MLVRPNNMRVGGGWGEEHVFSWRFEFELETTDGDRARKPERMFARNCVCRPAAQPISLHAAARCTVALYQRVLTWVYAPVLCARPRIVCGSRRTCRRTSADDVKPPLRSFSNGNVELLTHQLLEMVRSEPFLAKPAPNASWDAPAPPARRVNIVLCHAECILGAGCRRRRRTGSQIGPLVCQGRHALSALRRRRLR